MGWKFTSSSEDLDSSSKGEVSSWGSLFKKKKKKEEKK